jgi:hypothetical protein
MLTLSKVTTLKLPGLCDVTANPAIIGPSMFISIFEPGTAVHVTPSSEM